MQPIRPAWRFVRNFTLTYSFFFFFSSRRRHTRYWRDWSSACALPIFALPRVHGHSARGDGGGRMVLSGEDVARRPTNLRAQLEKRLDEHRGLDRHVQRAGDLGARSEEHTSELQSRQYLVCRLLLEKKK